MSSLLKSVCLICRSPKKLMCLVLAGLVSTNSFAFATEPGESSSRDVSLTGEGVLRGTVLNSAAQPVGGIQVAVLHGESVVATATSTAEGEFAVKGLRNGAHMIQVGQTVHPVRFWQSDMAPPAAVQQMAVVVPDNVVMGQQGGFFGGNEWVAPALVFGGVTALVLATTLGDDDSATAPASP